jgi:preprotein translocase subunit SecB
MDNKKKAKSEKIAEMAEKASLLNVMLKFVNADCKHNPYTIDPTKVRVDTKNESSFERVDDNLYCFIVYNLNGYREKSDSEILSMEESHIFEIKACFCVIYEIKGLSKFTDEDLDLFSSTNALYNTYPYAREFIQNIQQRMSSPVFVLPLLKPMTKKQLDSISTSDSE